MKKHIAALGAISALAVGAAKVTYAADPAASPQRNAAPNARAAQPMATGQQNGAKGNRGKQTQGGSDARVLKPKVPGNAHATVVKQGADSASGSLRDKVRGPAQKGAHENNSTYQQVTGGR